ncbi:dephospho-CoA kinase [Patescibacteria group bacterium]
MNKVIVGITGYLGSGKSTALKYFKEHGFYIIDADEIVHKLYEPENDGWRKINDFFGPEYILKNGKVNRKKLAKTVFCNPAKLRILEKIIHPIVFNEMSKEIQANKSDKIAIEAIRFDEKRIGAKLTHTVWVEADHDTAYKRVIEKRKLSREDYDKLISYQKKPFKIDFVIENNGSLKDLKKQIEKVVERI